MNETTVTTTVPATPTTDATIDTNPIRRLRDGWRKLFQTNRFMALVLLVLSAVLTVLQYKSDSSTSGPTDSLASGQAAPGWDITLLAIIGFGVVIGVIVGLVIGTYINGIITFLTWKTSRGESTSFKEAFKATTAKLGTLFLVTVVSGLKILGGLLLLIIPGIRAALRYQLVLIPVFDENLNTKQALARMKQIAQGRLMEIFGVTSIASIVPVLSLLLQIGGSAVLYTELRDQHDRGVRPASIHWLNYLLPIILLIVLLGFLIPLYMLVGQRTIN